jgi:hypothetical protein
MRKEERLPAKTIEKQRVPINTGWMLTVFPQRDKLITIPCEEKVR